MIMFILGMKAPGIMHQFEYLESDDINRRNVPPRVSYIFKQLCYFYVYSNRKKKQIFKQVLFLKFIQQNLFGLIKDATQ